MAPISSLCRIAANRIPRPRQHHCHRKGLQSSPIHVRGLQTTQRKQSQAQPLSGYYAEILSSQPTPAAAKETFPTKEPTVEEKARVVFGTRLAGSGYDRGSRDPDATWKTINGVPIPPRPAEPDNCCMSGCVHCVWDDYRDEIEDWAVRVKAAQAKAQAADKGQHITSGKLPTPARPEVADASGSMDDDGGGSETNWSPEDADSASDLFSGIPVGIREFMKTEKKLKQLHQQHAEAEAL